MDHLYQMHVSVKWYNMYNLPIDCTCTIVLVRMNRIFVLQQPQMNAWWWEITLREKILCHQMHMELKFLPNLEMRMKTSGSLEQVRYAIGRCLRSPGAIHLLPNGSAVGSIEENHFKLHFKKLGRNFWRPEFKGSLSTTDDHVTIHVRCGFSNEASILTFLLWTASVLIFIIGSRNFVAGHVSLHNLLSLCTIVFFVFALPCVMFWNEFRDDRIEMRSI